MRKQPLKNLQGKTQDKKTVAAMYSICTAKHKGNIFFQTEIRKMVFVQNWNISRSVQSSGCLTVNSGNLWLMVKFVYV